ncbi:MAG: GNAT family N-acetyltransferase [Pseudomonadota bacterium]
MDLWPRGWREGSSGSKKLYLAPERQNQGLGREVLDVICQRGFNQGLEVRLTVLTNNPAIQFYRRAGFEELERNTERVWMVKRCPEA